MPSRDRLTVLLGIRVEQPVGVVAEGKIDLFKVPAHPIEFRGVDVAEGTPTIKLAICFSGEQVRQEYVAVRDATLFEIRHHELRSEIHESIQDLGAALNLPKVQRHISRPNLAANLVEDWSDDWRQGT